jgi:hypothetical protein
VGVKRGQHRGHGPCAVVDARVQRPTLDHHLAQAGDALEWRLDVAVHVRPVELHVHGLALQARLQLRRGSLRHHAAPVDDRHLRRELVGLLHVVGREQDREALVGLQTADLLPHGDAHLGVEPGGGLVEEQHARPVHQADRDVEPALHPAGVGPSHAARGVGQAELLEELVDPAVEIASAHPLQVPLQLHVLPAGQVAVHAGALRHDADRAAYLARLPEHVPARHARPALVGVRERGEHLDGGGLARAVGAEQAEHCALLDGKGQTVERADVAVVLGEALCLDCIFHVGQTPGPDHLADSWWIRLRWGKIFKTRSIKSSNLSNVKRT